MIEDSTDAEESWWEQEAMKEAEASEKDESPCAWHFGQHPIAEDQTPGCSGCGSVYNTRFCDGCKEEFLDWLDKSWDDVCAGIYVTSSGDLYCTKCGPGRDRAQEQFEEDPEF